MWPDRRIIDLLGIEHPIPPRAHGGPRARRSWRLPSPRPAAWARSPCAMSSPEQIRTAISACIRQRTAKPDQPELLHAYAGAARSGARRRAGRRASRPTTPSSASIPASRSRRQPRALRRDDLRHRRGIQAGDRRASISACPEPRLLARVRAAGCKVIASATTAAEAKWLAERGCDAIIAQGAEGGGHRGMFLSDDVASQAGTFALVPQVVDAVKVPVIAAGGIADARGIVAALALGASAVQIGTAYLFCPEANVTALHRQALRKRPRRRHRPHQPVHRPPGARPHQPRDARSRAALGRGAGLPARRRRASAAEGRRRGQGSADFSALWSGTGRGPRPRDAGRRTHETAGAGGPCTPGPSMMLQ